MRLPDMLRRAPTIRQWLAMLLAAFIIPAAVAVLTLFVHSYGRERAGVERANLDVARALMQTIDRELASAQGALQALATSPNLHDGDLRAFYDQAIDVLHDRPGNILLLTGRDGRQVMNTQMPFGAPLPLHGNVAHLRAVIENAAGATPLRMGVNVTAAQFKSGRLVQTVERALRDANLPSRLLCIEITEQHQLADSAHTRAILAALKALGVLVAIDDFGTGYSSLGYISYLRPDELKIDKSLVTDVDSDRERAGLVVAALAMARSLNLMVVSEGVETEAERVFLRDHGCDMAQGFLYAQPLPAGEFERWLRAGGGAMAE